MSKVIVAGSINMDIVAFAKRHPKIGETVVGTNLKYFPGGKGANQAVASAKLGAKTGMLGKIGGDAFGEQLVTFLKQENIETKILIEPKVSTGIGIITVAEKTANNTIVAIPGANFLLTAEDIEDINLEAGDILVSQFEIPIETITAFFRKGKTAGTINILNSAPARIIPQDLLALVNILILNETELSFVSGISVDTNNEESVVRAAEKIKVNNLRVVVTIGERGAVAFDNGEIIKIPGRSVKSVDTTGAGDCFVGALAAGLAGGRSFPASLSLANAAASISVTREGAGPSMPSLNEVMALNLSDIAKL